MNDINELLLNLLSLNKKEIKTEIKHVHPIDLIDIFHTNNSNTVKELIDKLPEDYLAKLLDFEEDEYKLILFNLIDKKRHKKVINHMLSNELIDFIEVLDEDNSIYIKSLVTSNLDVNKFLSYKEDSAGTIMGTEFINIYETNTVLDTYHFLQSSLEENDMPYYLYITDKKNHLLGVIQIKDLLSSSFDKQIKDITNYQVTSINVNVDQEEVAYIFDKYDYLMLPVVDDDNVLVGVISLDDIIEVYKKETTEDIHRLAGIDEDEKVDGKLIDSIKSRLPWLLVNLFTASISALVINHYSDTINSLVLLAAINPIIAGMGGNAGNQSMTLIVRSIALKQINTQNAFKIFFKEIRVGLSIGLIIGIILTSIITIIFNNYYLGIIAGIAILINLFIATAIGFLVPITLTKLKIDPALASSVFVTATTDILGFLIFLSLATATINLLI